MQKTGTLALPVAWQNGLWVKLYRYRWLLHALVVRELKLRYKGSVFGFLWTLLNPLLFMGIYTLVFSVYLRIPVEKYPIFLLSGLIPWLWFSTAVQQGTTVIVDGASFITRTMFPMEVLPLVTATTNMVNFLFSLPLLLVFLGLYRVDLGWSVLTLPVIMLAQYLLIVGLTFLLAAYNVFFRDLQMLVGHLLTLLFFAVPIMYPLDQVPESFRAIVQVNPLTVLTQSYQNIFFYHSYPDWVHLGYLFGFDLLLLWWGKRVFDGHREIFSEYL